jgi:hypothetical protein
VVSRAIALLIVGTALGCGAAQPAAVDADPAIAELAWMSGTWYRVADGKANEELWSLPRGDTMIGTNRTIADGRAVYYEFLRIVATSDGVFYEAWPKGQPPARFRMIASREHEVVFEDPAHDWPQRISYQLVDGTLSARVEGSVEGKPRTESWSWSRVD